MTILSMAVSMYPNAIYWNLKDHRRNCRCLKLALHPLKSFKLYDTSSCVVCNCSKYLGQPSQTVVAKKTLHTQKKHVAANLHTPQTRHANPSMSQFPQWWVISCGSVLTTRSGEALALALKCVSETPGWCETRPEHVRSMRPAFTVDGTHPASC